VVVGTVGFVVELRTDGANCAVVDDTEVAAVEVDESDVDEIPLIDGVVPAAVFRGVPPEHAAATEALSTTISPQPCLFITLPLSPSNGKRNING
jgi:hypothetical protein